MIASLTEFEQKQLVAPFPYFGGKRAAVNLVWPLFGTVKNYVEPFCGSLAMLLGSPDEKRIETINDFSGFVVNFWRAIKAEPSEVAAWSDWPVTEIDLEARHGWLVNRSGRLKWCLQDPDFYDAKIAGWWCWGANAWIGSGWCLGKGPWISNGVELTDSRQLPHVGDAGQGINRQLPHVGNAGRGINRKLPHVGNAGRGQFIEDWFIQLSNRIRDVRITCGDWSRVVTPAATTRHGLTAVFLDPPYTADITTGLYENETGISADVRKWCVENGNNSQLRIVLCGYDREHELEGWTKLNGRATNGGYGNQANNQNHKRETLWASPHCIKTELDL